jgi:hypothetical protein
MRPRLALLLCTLLAASLAGCSGDGDDDPAGDDSSATPAPTASSYTVTLEGFPVAPIPANTTFTFIDRISGDVVRMSDHIGAHFGQNSTTDPSTTAYPNACAHTHGDLPGTYEVTCTAPAAPGAYFLRGHARIMQDNLTVNWWSNEQPFTVA